MHVDAYAVTCWYHQPMPANVLSQGDDHAVATLGVLTICLHNRPYRLADALFIEKVLDEQHKIPRISEVLGLILAEKHEFKGAAENLRMYLQLNPAAPDAVTIRRQLAAIEAESAR